MFSRLTCICSRIIHTLPLQRRMMNHTERTTLCSFCRSGQLRCVSMALEIIHPLI